VGLVGSYQSGTVRAVEIVPTLHAEPDLEIGDLVLDVDLADTADDPKFCDVLH
jgi:hypothetical protein